MYMHILLMFPDQKMHLFLPVLQQPKWFNLYLTLAFLTVLMTYFGVNYFLGGMHSYA